MQNIGNFLSDSLQNSAQINSQAIMCFMIYGHLRERDFHYLSPAFPMFQPTYISKFPFCYAPVGLITTAHTMQRTVAITQIIHDEQGICITFRTLHYHFHYNVGKLFIGKPDKEVHIYQAKPRGTMQILQPFLSNVVFQSVNH